MTTEREEVKPSRHEDIQTVQRALCFCEALFNTRKGYVLNDPDYFDKAHAALKRIAAPIKETDDD